MIRIPSKLELSERLVRIERDLGDVLLRYRPATASVETLFFHKDAQAAAKLGHARGVVLLALARSGTQVFEYAPARVKRTVTGNGQADKRQVALMVRAVLGLDQLPAGDAADALALALTHLRLGRGMPNALENGSARRTSPEAALRALLHARGRQRGRRPLGARLTDTSTR